MAVKIYIPTPLRNYTDRRESVEVEAATVGEALQHLISKYSALQAHLYTPEGQLRNYVNVYKNDEDIRYLEKEDTPVAETDELSIVPSIAGGIESVEAQLDEEVVFTNEEIARYSRHLIMPEVGIEGQKRLKAASVLMVGAGGLGSPMGMYLAAAGVGRLGIVDFDVVDSSNLHRQLLYSTTDVGREKLDAARERLSGINPNLVIETHESRLTSENALEIFEDYDIIADGTDNFPTRYLVNDACVLLNKPNVYGSIFRFEGQVSVFSAAEGPCYRCLYPEPPPPGLVPSCAEGGVLGVLPGIIGSLQALEVIKLILRNGDPLIGRLLLFDALKLKFRELKLRKDPDCPVCGTHPTIHHLIDYEQFCGIQVTEQPAENGDINEISPEELKYRLDSGENIFLLDVREPQEYQISNLGGYLIPLQEVSARAHELKPDSDIVVYCRSGVRSRQAIQILQRAGFRKLRNLEGGINAWAEKIDPSIPTY